MGFIFIYLRLNVLRLVSDSSIWTSPITKSHVILTVKMKIAIIHYLIQISIHDFHQQKVDLRYQHAAFSKKDSLNFKYFKKPYKNWNFYFVKFFDFYYLLKNTSNSRIQFLKMQRVGIWSLHTDAKKRVSIFILGNE